jgi:dihydroflavonol-4-reductase
MRVLVTGATGFIGYHVARILCRQGYEVRALVRNETDASCLEDLDIEPATGDITDMNSLYPALRGCRMLCHLAADYRLWVPDPKTMFAVNVQGTRNILHAAMMLSIERVVYTSTVGVLGRTRDGAPASEETPSDIREMVGHYKTSKFIAEREVEGFIKKGLPVVIVNPSTPVGAMDRKPTPTGQIIVDFMNNRIPAYLDTGLNIVDVEDVAAGHLLAARHGRVGQRYILGNRNVTLREFFGLLSAATGIKAPAFKLPYFPVLAAAHFDEVVSKIFRKRRPRIPLTGVQMAKHKMHFDCSKAVNELNLPQTPVEAAIEKAVQWFERNGYVNAGIRRRKRGGNARAGL